MHNQAILLESFVRPGDIARIDNAVEVRPEVRRRREDEYAAAECVAGAGNADAAGQQQMIAPRHGAELTVRLHRRIVADAELRPTCGIGRIARLPITPVGAEHKHFAAARDKVAVDDGAERRGIAAPGLAQIRRIINAEIVRAAEVAAHGVDGAVENIGANVGDGYREGKRAPIRCFQSGAACLLRGENIRVYVVNRIAARGVVRRRLPADENHARVVR